VVVLFVLVGAAFLTSLTLAAISLAVANWEGFADSIIGVALFAGIVPFGFKWLKDRRKQRQLSS
jgi:hypothetical protein